MCGSAFTRRPEPLPLVFLTFRPQIRSCGTKQRIAPSLQGLPLRIFPPAFGFQGRRRNGGRPRDGRTGTCCSLPFWCSSVLDCSNFAVD
jgi:hypothetical protein